MMMMTTTTMMLAYDASCALSFCADATFHRLSPAPIALVTVALCHRKFMHEIISSVKAADRAVILTTHSMEEADALCSRIGIMAKGQMRCLGTSVHLKQKHGKGFIIAMQTNPSDSDAAISFVRGAFPGAELTHNNAGHM